MKKEDFMGALSLYLSMSQASRVFALEVYGVALTLNFKKMPRSLQLLDLVDGLCEWVHMGMLRGNKPKWLHFKEGKQ